MLKIYTKTDLCKMFNCTAPRIDYLRKIRVIRPFVSAKKRGGKNLYNEDAVVALQKYFDELNQKKGFKGGAYKESKCWTCLKSYNGCSWSRKYSPVKGWKAKAVDISLTKDWKAYIVLKCPEYEKEEWIKNERGMRVRKNPIPEEWKEKSVRFEDIKTVMERKPNK